jgi:hypothetical protein
VGNFVWIGQRLSTDLPDIHSSLFQYRNHFDLPVSGYEVFTIVFLLIMMPNIPLQIQQQIGEMSCIWNLHFKIDIKSGSHNLYTDSCSVSKYKKTLIDKTWKR